MTQETTQPLYKALNEKRTSGNWYIEEWEHANSINTKLENNQEHTVFTDQFCYTDKFDGDKKSNIQYTALAVNNLANIADALQNLLDNPAPNPSVCFGADYFDKQSKFVTARNKAKEALKAIS